MLNKILLFLLIIFSLRYFEATIGKDGILKLASYGYIFLALIVSLPFFFKYKGGFVLPVQLISFSILLSIFMAKYTWDQGFEYSPTTLPYLVWFVFFYLLNTKLTIRTIESIILIYGLIYILLFLFQFTHNNVVYFGFQDEFILDRGVVRINFPGGGVFFLSCFIALNRITGHFKNKAVWGLYALIGLAIIVLQVTRQSIAVMLGVYLIHFLRNAKLPLKIVTAVLFIAAGYVFINSDNSISKGLAAQQKNDVSAGNDYIRVVAGKYFLTQFTPNIESKIFGNGVSNETSNYGKKVKSLEDNDYYFITDVGLIEVYILFGIIAIIGYLMIFVLSFKIPVPPGYYYLKYYLWLILATSLTSDALISNNYLMTTVLVLYCYQKLYIQAKQDRVIIEALKTQSKIWNIN